MASMALESLEEALEEIAQLQIANPTPTGAFLAAPGLTRAIGRASVVLLSSHFERYIYAINEEAAEALNRSSALGETLPLMLRLSHSRHAKTRRASVGRTEDNARQLHRP